MVKGLFLVALLLVGVSRGKRITGHGWHTTGTFEDYLATTRDSKPVKEAAQEERSVDVAQFKKYSWSHGLNHTSGIQHLQYRGRSAVGASTLSSDESNVQTRGAMNPVQDRRRLLTVPTFALFFACVSVACGLLSGRLEIRSTAVCACYLALSLWTDIEIASQKASDGKRLHNGHLFTSFSFDPVCAATLVEIVKFLVSGFLCIFESVIVDKPPLPTKILFAQSRWLALPAVIFTANGLLVFAALGTNDVATYGVFRDTVIIWTALIRGCIFGNVLGTTRILSVIVIFCGLFVNRLPGLLSADAHAWGIAVVCMMACTNALGSVSSEFAIKANVSMSLNLQNSIMFGMQSAMCVLTLVALRPHILAEGFTGFFNGFTRDTFILVCLRAVAGLVCTRILKYAGAMAKSVTTCLRGPLLVFSAPFLFPGTVVSPIGMLSALVVAIGCFGFLAQGPLPSLTGSVLQVKCDAK